MSTLTEPPFLMDTSGKPKEPLGLAGTATPSIAITRRALSGLRVVGSAGDPRVTNDAPASKIKVFEVSKPSRRTHPGLPLLAAPGPPGPPRTFKRPLPARVGATRRIAPPLPPPP